MATLKQKIMVGKDRLLDDLSDMNYQNGGYWSIPIKERNRIKKMGQALIGNDNDPETLTLLDKLGYINGTEGSFFGE